MLEKLESCPICKNLNHEKVLECKDFTVSGEVFSIVACRNCTFKFTNPRPEERIIHKYYESKDYISHNDSGVGPIDIVYRAVRKKTLQNKLNLINRLSYHKGKLLDIGCGTGSFLEICKKNGWETKGIEPDKTARKRAQQLSNSTIEANFLLAYPNETFDIITMWHVLEHVYALDETIQKIKKNLSENGKIIVAVPNCNSFDANLYQQYWAAYDVPRHLYHFSKETIKLLFQKHGLKVEEIIPMKFDAFYICLLSWKYKTKKTNFFKAIREGIQSNRIGSNDNNYSSLTFVISK